MLIGRIRSVGWILADTDVNTIYLFLSTVNNVFINIQVQLKCFSSVILTVFFFLNLKVSCMPKSNLLWLTAKSESPKSLEDTGVDGTQTWLQFAQSTVSYHPLSPPACF